MDWESKDTQVPGPRIRVQVDIAADSLPLLLEGQPAESVRLIAQDDGSYSLHAVGRMQANRAAGVKPAADVLVDLINDINSVVQEHKSDIPQTVLDAFEQAAQRWEKYNGERQEPTVNDSFETPPAQPSRVQQDETLRRVVEALPMDEMSRLEQTGWWLAANGWLGGQRPADMLLTDPAAVQNAAQHMNDESPL
jgi:hypothetical protein